VKLLDALGKLVSDQAACVMAGAVLAVPAWLALRFFHPVPFLAVSSVGWLFFSLKSVLGGAQ
jgi:hypothetical protein